MYAAKYEAVDVAAPAPDDDGDADDLYAADPEGRSVSTVLEENKAIVNNVSFWRDDVSGTLAGLKSAILALKTADSDRLMAGKIWQVMNNVHGKLSDLEDEDERFQGLADLWMTRWNRQHHAVYSLAHVLHPDHNESSPLSDASVQADVTKMMKRFFPDITIRARVSCSSVRLLSDPDCVAGTSCPRSIFAATRPLLVSGRGRGPESDLAV
jgi:hypothetical protein